MTNKIYSFSGTRIPAFPSMLLILTVGFCVLPWSVACLTHEQRMNTQAKYIAIKNLTVILNAQKQYFSAYGTYADAMTEFGPPTTGNPTREAADLLPKSLAVTGETSGYKYVVNRSLTGYTINANPLVFGTTGTWTLFSDESMLIHEHHGPEPASLTDPEMGAGNHPIP